MNASSDIALGVVLAPAAAATSLQAASVPPSATASGQGAAPPADAAPAPAATTALPAASTTSAAAPAHAPFVPAPHRGTTATQVAAAATPGQAPSAAGAVGGTVFALLFVVGLILALAWLARRMPGVAGSSNRALRVVASLSLGPREKVVVVDVGGQQLLLGVGAGGTRALHTLSVPLPEAERAATPAFAQLLAQHFGKKA